jgi:hypothetical protein
MVGVELTVQIRAGSVISDRDGIPTDIERLVMQKPVDVPNGVNHKADRVEQLRRARA